MAESMNPLPYLGRDPTWDIISAMYIWAQVCRLQLHIWRGMGAKTLCIISNYLSRKKCIWLYWSHLYSMSPFQENWILISNPILCTQVEKVLSDPICSAYLEIFTNPSVYKKCLFVERRGFVFWLTWLLCDYASQCRRYYHAWFDIHLNESLNPLLQICQILCMYPPPLPFR